MTVLLVLENVGRYFDEKRVQLGLVPLVEHGSYLVDAHRQRVEHDVIGLADQLHVAVLDAIVHHLDEMARTVLANPVAARLAVYFGRYGLKDGLDVGPRLRSTARHYGRTVSGALFATRHAGADEEEASRLQIVVTSLTVSVGRIATVDDDVARLQ